MTMNREGRPTAPENAGDTAPDTFTGNRALRIEEPVIFDVGTTEATGVDLPEPDASLTSRLGGLERTEPLDLPGLAEPEAMRHYVRLSQKNYAIDMGLYPLGSCTMKHNPRLNEKMARLPGFADVHPLQPVSTVPGALELIAECAPLAVRRDGHGGRRHEPEGRRPWRTLRHDGDQGGPRRPWRGPLHRAGPGIRPRHQPGDRGTARLQGRRHSRPRGRNGRSRRRHRAPVGRRRRHHADQPEHLRPLRARHRGDRQGGARGRRLFLLRRRQPQRHPRQGPAGRPRRRLHAHQPAQDVFHAPWRRRPRRRPGGAVGAARGLRPAALRQDDRRRP